MTAVLVQEIGLDRLVLPSPDEPFAPCGSHRAARPGNVSRDENTRAWHRWMLGHHAAFCVWRLMSEVLAAGTAGVAAALYHAYSALLLYSGSCTPAVYDSVIRPRMRAAHPAFSGTWARDYRQVRAHLAEAAPAAGSPLKEAVKFNRLVHMSVAARLVPGGGSLLRDSARDVHAAPTQEETDLFDSFFLTDRGPVCAHDFVTHLRLRVATIRADLDDHPLDVHYDRAALNEFQSHLATHLAFPAEIAESVLTEGAKNRD